MVQSTINDRSIAQRYGRTPEILPKPKTVIIVYDQPKVVIVRRYTKTIVSHVNPVEYQRQYNHVLLDTSTLLALTRRLNIQEHLV
jgi:hypothetical protein